MIPSLERGDARLEHFGRDFGFNFSIIRHARIRAAIWHKVKRALKGVSGRGESIKSAETPYFVGLTDFLC